MLEYSIKTLQEQLQSHVLNHNIHLLLPKIFTEDNLVFPKNNFIHHLPNDAPTIANYYYLVRTAELAAYLSYSKARHNSMAAASLGKGLLEPSTSTVDSIPTISHLLHVGLRKANIFICVSAWLTVDSKFRWHDICPNIEEDLSYGIATQYLDYVVPLCTTLLDITRQEFLNNLDKNLLDYLYSQSIKDTKGLYPTAIGIKEFLEKQPIV